jgi:hypothetical protein
MKNFWLDRYKIGKRVKYIGGDQRFFGMYGIIVDINHDLIEIQFIMNSMFIQKYTLIVKKSDLLI